MILTALAAAQAPDVKVDGVFVGSVRHFERLNASLARRAIRPVVDRSFPFERAPEAYARLAGGGLVGKVGVTV